MLVLSRFHGEKVAIGNNIIVTVVEIRGNKVRLGFEAPTDVSIDRMEIRENQNYKSKTNVAVTKPKTVAETVETNEEEFGANIEGIG